MLRARAVATGAASEVREHPGAAAWLRSLAARDPQASSRDLAMAARCDWRQLWRSLRHAQALGARTVAISSTELLKRR